MAVKVRLNGFGNFGRNKYHTLFRALVLLCIAAFPLVKAPAQIQSQSPPPDEDDKPISVNTLLFTVPLTVNDAKGRSFPALKKEDFKIYQDGEEQDITLFLNEETPMNVAILLDTSYSTKEVLDDIRRAAKDFVKILRPDDKAVIVGFDRQTRFLSDLTGDRKILSKAIDEARVNKIDGSDMYAAVDAVLQRKFATLNSRKAIIVLTDGMVIPQKITAQTTLNEMQKADTFFYPIIFKTDFYGKPKSGKSGLVNMLKILSEETNGTFYEKDSTKLKEAFQSIAEDLKRQYLIGFYPESSENGKSSGRIRVDVDRRGLFIRTRKKLIL